MHFEWNTFNMSQENTHKNDIFIISLINFVISSDGAYINWIVTHEGKYNKAAWKWGDNIHFEKRGLVKLLLLVVLSFLNYLDTNTNMRFKQFI